MLNLDNALEMYMPDVLELSRDKLIKNVNKCEDKLTSINQRNQNAITADNIIKNSDIDNKILSLDTLAFIEIEIFDKEFDNSLFGEISKVIEDCINEELNEINDTYNKDSFIRNITPFKMLISTDLEKNNLLDNMFLNDDNTLTTLKYMEIYNELNQDVASISKRSEEKVKENEKILLFMNANIQIKEQTSENYMKNSILYTAALTSSIKDNSNPNIDIYRKNVIENINKSINALITSKDINASIKIMDSGGKYIENCQEQLKDINSDIANKTKEIMNVIKETYQEKLPEIKETFSNEL